MSKKRTASRTSESNILKKSDSRTNESNASKRIYSLEGLVVGFLILAVSIIFYQLNDSLNDLKVDLRNSKKLLMHLALEHELQEQAIDLIGNESFTEIQKLIEEEFEPELKLKNGQGEPSTEVPNHQTSELNNSSSSENSWEQERVPIDINGNSLKDGKLRMIVGTNEQCRQSLLAINEGKGGGSSMAIHWYCTPPAQKPLCNLSIAELKEAEDLGDIMQAVMKARARCGTPNMDTPCELALIKIPPMLGPSFDLMKFKSHAAEASLRCQHLDDQSDCQQAISRVKHASDEQSLRMAVLSAEYRCLNPERSEECESAINNLDPILDDDELDAVEEDIWEMCD